MVVHSRTADVVAAAAAVDSFRRFDVPTNLATHDPHDDVCSLADGDTRRSPEKW